ncbi:TraB/GumN family protein [Marinicella sp. S1101]|uniref:TraB/GumN family protein n=1 Tax=Marinicella marina TaxID=2996016 RepID=UPI002260C55F|nr:TraB/GumN family protein [Marinicella marina]MCX7554873.1 TraB/GumN family protein [Marinicella marina]MDJ1141531.1 TraB/GumN family protein [Marinicella marina]
MEIKHKIITFVLLIIVTFMASATNKEPLFESSLLWKITGPNIEQPSYIAGTVHIMCEKDYVENPRFVAALEQTEQLYFEIHLEDPSEMMSLMINDVPLEERLSPAQYKQLEEVIGKYTDYDINMFKNMEIFAISALLLVTSLDCPIIGVEDALTTLAGEKNIPIKSLESLDEQITVMKAMEPPISDKPWTDDEMKAYLMIPEVFGELLQAYYSEDIKTIYNMTIRELNRVKNSADLINTILDERNIKWIERIPPIIQKQPTLFAVGAAHLGGPNGVINLLKKAGYEVTPVLQ